MDNMNHNEYREIIEQFARDRVDQRVSNGMPMHAKILLETIFKTAAAEVRIFTGELNESVFGDKELKRSVKKFLSKPYSNLQILIQKENDNDWMSKHPFISFIKSLESSEVPHGSVEIRFAQGAYSSDEAKHFSVMDNDGYRFEHDHSNTLAVANFNEPKTAQQLRLVFDVAFSNAKKSAYFLSHSHI